MNNTDFTFSYTAPAFLKEALQAKTASNPVVQQEVPETPPAWKVYQGAPLYISDQEIKELLNISQVTLWRWTTKLGFPKPIPGMKGRRPYAEFMAWAKERGMV
ncbi:TPA: DNA-binding protein [Vibrio cholerae]|nr:helix-turn-helix domain-containing protein [Vibrio cholerae]AKB03767.1 hypothetical protein VAA049_1642 [Vibrio cholerae]EGR2419368.1 DNA-binding protein [Vibrio cholerae]EGR4327476.1 DNA-binding protein [Vibrio cholerae]EGR4477811.1 DNA-binding protein [Vibrio cholerae]EGR5152124.1 DNA-binding protein [Vibrio cholerae]